MYWQEPREGIDTDPHYEGEELLAAVGFSSRRPASNEEPDAYVWVVPGTRPEEDGHAFIELNTGETTETPSDWLKISGVVPMPEWPPLVRKNHQEAFREVPRGWNANLHFLTAEKLNT